MPVCYFTSQGQKLMDDRALHEYFFSPFGFVGHLRFSLISSQRWQIVSGSCEGCAALALTLAVITARDSLGLAFITSSQNSTTNMRLAAALGALLNLNWGRLLGVGWRDERERQRERGVTEMALGRTCPTSVLYAREHLFLEIGSKASFSALRGCVFSLFFCASTTAFYTACQRA